MSTDVCELMIQLGDEYLVPKSKIQQSNLYGTLIDSCDDTIQCLPIVDNVPKFAIQDYVNFLNRQSNKSKQ
jgi:hypothetical protein